MFIVNAINFIMKQIKLWHCRKRTLIIQFEELYLKYKGKTSKTYMTYAFHPCPFIRICIYCDGNSATLRTKDGCAWLRHFVLSFPSFDGKCRFRTSPVKLWIWPHSVKGETFRLNILFDKRFSQREIESANKKKTVWFFIFNISCLKNVLGFVSWILLGSFKLKTLFT